MNRNTCRAVPAPKIEDSDGPDTRLAKLTRPALTAAFARTRLFEILDRHKNSPVIWLAGPPGAGKTTLAAD